jgi:hypothetical protein
MDASEAEAVLAALSARETAAGASEEIWERIFATEPYRRLKQREASLHRDFTDEEFRAFVNSPDLAERAPALRRTLDACKREDLVAAARRVLAYLPADAVIRAKVYLLIKPRTNSFVFDLASDPTIFLYLDPDRTAAQAANTVAHELHHIGFASVEGRVPKPAVLSPAARKALEWMGAFGEGFAMLAAAGSPDVHPHASSPPADRERWDRDMLKVDADTRTLDAFFRDVLDGRLRTEAEIDARAFTFFGIQGPWYTVGYRMAVLIEKRGGRSKLVECMSDPRELLSTYNRLAREINAREKRSIALWSDEVVSKIGATATPSVAAN